MDYKRQYQEGKEKKLQAKLEKEEKIKQLKLQHAPSQEIRDLENPPKKPLLPACAKKKKKPDAKYEMVQTEREKEKKKKRALCFKSNKTSDF